MLVVALLAGCHPGGPVFSGSVGFDGPELRVDPELGELSAPFVIGVSPIPAGDKPAPHLSYGFFTSLTFASEGPATVRVITTTDADGLLVPTPWDVEVSGTADLSQASAAMGCARGADRCETSYALALEVRSGGPVDVAWRVDAWVSGDAGSADRVSEQTIPDVVFGDPS